MKSTSLAIKRKVLSIYKPGTSNKEDFDVVGPFMINTTKSQRHIFL